MENQTLENRLYSEEKKYGVEAQAQNPWAVAADLYPTPTILVEAPDQCDALNGERAILGIGYYAEFVSEIKKVPGHRWDPKRKLWFVPAGQAQAARKVVARVWGEQ